MTKGTDMSLIPFVISSGILSVFIYFVLLMGANIIWSSKEVQVDTHSVAHRKIKNYLRYIAVVFAVLVIGIIGWIN